MTSKNNPKPLRYAGPETAGTLPIEELLANDPGFSPTAGQPHDPLKLPLNSLEAALAKTMFEYLTSDPMQRTYDNVLLVVGFIALGVAAFDESIEFDPPKGQNWEIIHKLSESQISAALGLMSMYAAHNNNLTTDQLTLLQESYVRSIQRTISEHEAIEVRKERARGGKARASKDPKAAAMLEIKKEFQRWKQRKVTYVNNSRFAEQMHARFEIIGSARSIENKCTEWERERRAKSSS